MKCPDCKGKLIEHTEGEKAGRGHCNDCGICWPAQEPEGEVLDAEDAPKPRRKS